MVQATGLTLIPCRANCLQQDSTMPVHEALDWLADLDEQSECYRDISDGAGIRVFTKEETDRLSEESLHFLSVFLKHAGAITPGTA